MTAPHPDETERAHLALARQKRLSLQYATASGLIALAAIILDAAWLSLAVWGIFVIWLTLRLRAARMRLEDGR